MTELYSALVAIGFQVEGKECSFDSILSGRLPAICHMSTPAGGHYAVLERADGDRVSIVDGKGQRLWVAKDQFLREWTGRGLEVTCPTDRMSMPYMQSSRLQAGRILFDSVFQDAGDIAPEAGTVDYVFSFQNGGRADLKVTGVRTSCRCSVSNYKPGQMIPPGGRGEIRISYDASATPGSFGSLAWVETNDPVFPRVQLNLAGNSARRILYYPQALSLGTIAASKEGRGTLLLQYFGDGDLVLNGAVAHDSGLSCRYVKLSPSDIRTWASELYGAKVIDEGRLKWFVVQVAYSPQKEGEVRSEVEFLTNDSKVPTFRVPFSAHVIGAVRKYPDVLSFGEVHADDSVSGEVEVDAPEGDKMRIVRVDAPEGIRVAYDSGREERTHVLKVTGNIAKVEQIATGLIVHAVCSNTASQVTEQIPLYARIVNSSSQLPSSGPGRADNH